MEKEAETEGESGRLPLPALRLLVSPMRLVSAVVWQTIRHKAVADYGMLEEFVSTVTDTVPELLTSCQRAQLILGLRARVRKRRSQLILELCRCDASADPKIVGPHLDRMQSLIGGWEMEAGAAANTDASNSDFVNIVMDILTNLDTKENFFQKVFPEEFGPAFDEALHSLMWLLLSRLEKFLPLQNFQQVAAALGDVSSVLEECMEPVSRFEELRTPLQWQKNISQLDHKDDSLGCTCIISALKLPSVKAQAKNNIVDEETLCTSELEKEPSTLIHTKQIRPDTFTEHQRCEVKTDNTNWIPAENTSVVFRHENAGVPQSPAEDSAGLPKQCCVPLSFQSRPVRRNRGLKMKQIMLEEKRGVCEKAPTACKPASRKTIPLSRAPPEISDDEDSNGEDSSHTAPVSICSEDDSWSYYSDEDSCHRSPESSPSLTDSWSNYSGEASTPVTPVSSSSDLDSPSNCSDEEALFTSPCVPSAPGRQLSISNVRASSPKKISNVYCFICKEHVSTSLRTHMKTHFPSGDYACPRCDSRFKLFTSFKMHLRRTCFEYGKQQFDPEKPDDAKNLYKCDQCREAFRYKVSLDRHKLTHHRLYCSVCRKVLRDSAALARHKASHTLFQCTRCEDAFALFLPLLRHCENVHEISRPFKCNRCPKTLPKLRLLILHEWTHTGHLPFQCPLCSCRFKSDADLIYHGRVHTKEKPYLCSECGKTFSQNSNLLRHLNLVHGEFRNEKRHSCSQCEKSFKEKGALKKHQRSKHLNQVFRHPCPYCGKMVSTSTLARHKLIHTGERPFKCTMPECDKYFRSSSEVKKHVLMQHTTDRPYKCEVCGKGFIRMCFLNSHVKTHSGEKPFVCHICGKAFLKHYSMQRHKTLVHTFVAH